MDSSSLIGHSRASTHRLWYCMPFSRFLGIVGNLSNHIKLTALRHLGVRALLLVDVLVGLWLAGTYIYIFHALSSGGMVGEPNIAIARTELWLSIGVTSWFLWQVPYWALKLLKKP
jgi:hypothetical protein